MFRARSHNNIGDSEREAKFVQERIDTVEKHFGEFCTVFAAYTRKAARLRDKNDEVAKTIHTYTESEEINRSLSACLANFAKTLSIIGDYRDAEVQRLNTNVIEPLSQYQNTCRRSRENVKSTFAARDEELKRKRVLEKTREENPKNQQKISKAHSELMKATVEVSRVVKELEEQIDVFEKQKLHDLKKIILSFVTVQLSFHAKAVELFTKAYRDVAEINEAQDLQDYQIMRGEINGNFRETMKTSEQFAKLNPFKRFGFREAHSLMNLNKRSTPSPTNLGKQKLHKTTESLDSLKSGDFLNSVEVEEFDESSEEAEEIQEVEETEEPKAPENPGKSQEAEVAEESEESEESSDQETKPKGIAMEENKKRKSVRLILKMVPNLPKYQKNLSFPFIQTINHS